MSFLNQLFCRHSYKDANPYLMLKNDLVKKYGMKCIKCKNQVVSFIPNIEQHIKFRKQMCCENQQEYMNKYHHKVE